MRLLLPLLPLLALTSCGPAMIDAAQYDQTCTQDTDCVPVRSGEACAVCGCANAAINTRDQSRYTKDLEGMRTWCGPQPVVACGACMQSQGVCVSGACALRQMP